MTNQLVLASGSPRRRQLLSQLGLEFDIEHPDVDETVRRDEAPQDYVVRLSQSKAEAVFSRLDSNQVIIAADTTVELAGNILGKPESKDDGIAMLTALSGSEHHVYTGVTIRQEARIESLCIGSLVRFRQLSDEEMDYYWETGEPVDKAGGYGLQGIGAAFVETLNGSYTNVIGLPLSEVVVLLREFGIPCLGEQGAVSEARKESFVVKGSLNG